MAAGSINALIGAQRSASVIDRIANPPSVNPLAGIQAGADAAKTVIGVRQLAAQNAWGQALAAATDPRTGVVDYPGALKSFSTTPYASYGMPGAVSSASPMQNDQVSRAHYQLGVYQGLFNGVPDNATREQLLATIDKGIALGLSPTDGASEKSVITSTADEDLPSLVQQFKLSGANATEAAGLVHGAGGLTAWQLAQPFDIKDQKGNIIEQTTLGEAMRRMGSLGGSQGAPQPRPAAPGQPPTGTQPPPNPSNIVITYPNKAGGSPNSAPSPNAAPVAAAPSIPATAFAPPASVGAPSATVTTTPPIVIPSGPAAAAPAARSVPSAPSATYGGPPAVGGGSPGSVLPPPPAPQPQPAGAPAASNVLAPSLIDRAKAYASLFNPIGTAEAATPTGVAQPGSRGSLIAPSAGPVETGIELDKASGLHLADARNKSIAYPRDVQPIEAAISNLEGADTGRASETLNSLRANIQDLTPAFLQRMLPTSLTDPAKRQAYEEANKYLTAMQLQMPGGARSDVGQATAGAASPNVHIGNAAAREVALAALAQRRLEETGTQLFNQSGAAGEKFDRNVAAWNVGVDPRGLVADKMTGPERSAYVQSIGGTTLKNGAPNPAYQRFKQSYLDGVKAGVIQPQVAATPKGASPRANPLIPPSQ